MTVNKDLYFEVSASQKPAIELLQSMGYTYISPKDCERQRGSRYHVLLKDILRGQLRKLNRYSYAGAENEFSAANIERAMEELSHRCAARADDALSRSLSRFEYGLVAVLCIAVGLVLLSVMLPLLGVLSAIGG